MLVGQILADGGHLAHGLGHVGGHGDGLAGQRGLAPALLGLILGGQGHVGADEVLAQLIEGALGGLGVHVAPGRGEDQVHLLAAGQHQGVHGLVVAPGHEGGGNAGVEGLEVIVDQLFHAGPVVGLVADEVNVDRVVAAQVGVGIGLGGGGDHQGGIQRGAGADAQGEHHAQGQSQGNQFLHGKTSFIVIILQNHPVPKVRGEISP